MTIPCASLIFKTININRQNTQFQKDHQVSLSLLLMFVIRHIKKKKKTLLAHLRPHTFVMIATAQKKMNRIFIVQKSIESLLSCCRLRIFFRFFSLVQRGESRNEKNKTFNKQKKEKKIAVNEIELTYSFTAFYSCSSLYLPVSLAFFSSSLFHVFSTHKMHRGKKRQTTRQEQ